MKNTSEDTELLLLPQLGNDKIPNYKQVVQATLHHFYILGVIEGSEKYLDLIHTLKTAEEHDTIFIYLNSVGGSLSTTVQIINAMQNCNGTVITCLEGDAYSAATVIFLCGHKHIINPFGSFMVHKYSHRAEGKGSEVAAQIRFTERYFDEIAYSVYADLMTTEEIELMLKDQDFWFTSKEVFDRLSKSNREILGSESDAIPLTGTNNTVVVEAIDPVTEVSVKTRKGIIAKNIE